MISFNLTYWAAQSDKRLQKYNTFCKSMTSKNDLTTNAIYSLSTHELQTSLVIFMRMPQGDHEHVLETIRVCQEWSKQLPLLFPERNITRKGHVLSIHVPEFLLKYPNLYYMFYKLEQRGEAIHALFNKLHRQKFQCIRPAGTRLLMMIEELERIHAIDKEITKARQYNKRVRS